MSTGESNLPNELVVSVLEHLSYEDLMSCEQVRKILHCLPSLHLTICFLQSCPRFRDLVADCTSLRYVKHLAIAGMEDNPRNPLSTAEKLRCLTQYRQTWNNLSTANMTFKQENVHIFDGPVWELTSGVLAHRIGREKIEFRRLPSSLRGVEENVWRIELGFSIDDFKIDPGQDLLVSIQLGPINEHVMPMLCTDCL